MSELFQVIKEEMRKLKKANVVGDANHATQREIMPNWED